jgi:hypothetical protein
VVGTIPSIYTDEAIALLNGDLQVGADEGRRASRSNKSSEQEPVCASLFARRIEYRHFLDLKHSVSAMSRSKVAEWLRDWLDAGIHTGGRPMEWALTCIERQPDRSSRHKERIWLHVISAKAAEGPGTYTYRTLDISGFSVETLEAIERMVHRSRDWVLSGQSAMWQSEVSKLLHKTCKGRFPRMEMQYTLYSLRHQFIANMITIYSRDEVDAIADHVSTDAQPEHYSKRRAGWTDQQITEVPKPVYEQVAQITRRHEFFDQRRAIKAMKEAARRRAE